MARAAVPQANLVTRAGFESNDGIYKIEFVTDKSVVLSEIGQTELISLLHWPEK